MGTKGREIVGMDIDKLIELLNKALADEWLAYYQYWVGAKVSYPCAQIIMILDKPRYQQKRHNYQQNQVKVYRNSFRYKMIQIL